MAVAHSDSPFITTYRGLPFTQITFNTPPALDDVITADYIVDGVHKTDQYVIDASFAIQFGEGV
jgi:phosphosulfolactate phosphohydrolase-like enzyme